MQVGKTLEILIDREGYHYRFVSKIEGVTAYSVAVSLIANAKCSFHFEESDQITIVYRSDRMWKWEHVKGGIAMLEGFPVHTFFTKEEGTTYNRREAYRVPMGENVLMHYYVKEKNENPENEDDLIIEKPVPFDAWLSDLSTSGAGLFTNEELDAGAKISFDLATNIGVISCTGHIVRESSVYDRPFKHFYGCEFSVVKNSLERYLVERQRMILQRERGGESMPLK
ncbi:MAG: PilZ domain-containing protein [Lachnospiraceae bacterium]|nr:PilZ domain-containing protein [Lachnospiraceae bacterium]